MKKIILILFMLSFTVPALAQAQEPYIGEIKMFGGNFAPRGWALCDGQLLSIAQNQALFSILGTTYGGDGRTTFGLPDLRGRVPIHVGTGAGLSPKRLGEKGGQENVTLTVNQLPSHSHSATVQISADSTVATSDKPENLYPARNAGSTPQYGDTANTTLGVSTVTVNNTGGNQSHSIMQPYNTVTYIIALVGIYPSRN